mmetsp:Transcript_11917/g.11984  ORF Transcript_11917/g.11984 Transcript_11917/m.11984 type:complete len:298 (+) Transcript_11917:233-1126(+)
MRFKSGAIMLSVATMRVRGFATEAALLPLKSSKEQVYVVSTASRGLGLEFTRQLLSRTEGRVVALTRSPASAPSHELSQLLTQHPNRLHITQVDLEDQESVISAGSSLSSYTDRVDLLLNVAGLLGDGSSSPGPERSVAKIDREWLRKTMEVNLIGHVMMTQQLFPLLTNKQASNLMPTVVNVSARVGSIEDNGLGGWYSYRMSKSAVNMFTRTLDLELKRYGGLSLSLHPGTVATSLSEPFMKMSADNIKLFTPAHSINMLLNIIWREREKEREREKGSERGGGKCYAYDGSVIPW